MKKLKTLLGIVLPTAVCAGAVFAFSAVAANKYDVTGDGKVNSHDLVNMMKYLSGAIDYDPDTTDSDKITDIPEVPDNPKETDTSEVSNNPQDTNTPEMPDTPKDTDTSSTEPDVPASPIVEIVGPEDFPGEDLPFDVVAVALGFDGDTDSTLVFDNAAKAAAYLKDRELNRDRPEAAQELLRLVSEIDTSEKRIIVLNLANISMTDYFSSFRQLEKLSLSGSKLGMLYVNNDYPDIQKDCVEACITTVVTVNRSDCTLLSERPDVERYIYSPYMTEKAPSIVEIASPEAFPGEGLQFDTVATALGYDLGIDSTLVFDNSAKAAEYLNRRNFEFDNLEDIKQMLKLVSEIDTSEKRIIVFNLEYVKRADYYESYRQLAKLSLNDSKLGMLYANNDIPESEKESMAAYCITTVVTVDRTAAESLSAKPDVERYIYKTVK